MKEFLKAKHVGILLFNLLHHLHSCLASLIVVSFHFKETSHIPGCNANARRVLGFFEINRPPECNEHLDALNTQQNGNCRYKGESSLEKKPPDQRDEDCQQQKRKAQSEE